MGLLRSLFRAGLEPKACLLIKSCNIPPWPSDA
jgi:hypothetical protein